MKRNLLVILLGVWGSMPFASFGQSLSGSNYASEQFKAGPQNEIPSNGKEARTYWAYSGSNLAPLGLSFGVLTNGGGLMFSGRISPDVLNLHSPYYEMSDVGGINDDFWVFNYTGGREYRRVAVTAAYIQKIAGEVANTSTHLYFGLGYGFVDYLYEYSKDGTSGNSYGNEWIKYTDISEAGVELEGGLIVDFKGINLNLGYSILNMVDSLGMYTFGLGFSF